MLPGYWAGTAYLHTAPTLVAPVSQRVTAGGNPPAVHQLHSALVTAAGPSI
jgi:hypothetical protein